MLCHYKALEEPCKSCIGKCFRVEDINFISDPNCRWQEKKTAQDYIEQIKLNLGEKK